MKWDNAQDFANDGKIPNPLFFGRMTGEDAKPLFVSTEKHAITIASSRSGKGVGVIIPNLRQWPNSALVIDPKGEAAEATAEQREKIGQKVYVLDPFKIADVPERFRASLNLLSELDPQSPRIREDINVIADGLVMRHDPKSGFWDGGGLSVIAGLIAHVLTGNHNHPKTLPTVREFLTANADRFAAIVDEMEENHSCGRLAATAAGKLTKTGTEAGHFLSVADENTKWLDSVAMSDLLGESDFSLRDLKREKVTVFLVLPVDLLEEHGRFLRLFVRCAIAAMAQPVNGQRKGESCLFLLDEFPALGHMSEIAKSSGLMPGYGVHLWPFVQDIGQLLEVYGHDGTHTFFGNADLHQFFGSVDKATLEYVSSMVGGWTQDDFKEHFDEAEAGYPDEKTMFWLSDVKAKMLRENALARHNAVMDAFKQMHGRPRLEGEKISQLIAKGERGVSVHSINFVKGTHKILAQVDNVYNPLMSKGEKHAKKFWENKKAADEHRAKMRKADPNWKEPTIYINQKTGEETTVRPKKSLLGRLKKMVGN